MKSRLAILLFLAAALPGWSETSAPTAERIVLSNDTLRAEIAPEWAGRLVFLGRPGGANALWVNPCAGNGVPVPSESGRRVWPNYGGNKTWVGETEAAWPGFQEPPSDASWPPPKWFDAAPLAVVRADATNALLRSGFHANAALGWTVALEREFTLLPDRLVLREQLIDFSPVASHCFLTQRRREAETQGVGAFEWDGEFKIFAMNTLRLPLSAALRDYFEWDGNPVKSNYSAIPDDPRRVWSNTQIPFTPHVAIRKRGEGRERLLRGCPAPVPRGGGSTWADLDLSTAPKHARIDADGDALAAEIHGVGWLLIEQVAPERCLGAFATPSRAIVYTLGGAAANPFVELEFVALGPDAGQTIAFRLLDTMPQ